jgi:hypothetical protein
MATDIQKNQKIKFKYKKLNGDETVVDSITVDEVSNSQEGHEIVTGYLDEDTARSYRADRITEVEVL